MWTGGQTNGLVLWDLERLRVVPLQWVWIGGGIGYVRPVEGSERAERCGLREWLINRWRTDVCIVC